MTDLITSMIVGIGTGVASSLSTWWLLTHRVAPRLRVSTAIAMVDGDDFRVKVMNESRRDAVDVEMRAYLLFDTEIPGESFTLLFRTRRLDRLAGRAGGARNDWWTHLRPEGVSADHLDAVQHHLPSWAYVALATGRAVDLERLLSSRPEGPIAVRIVVVAKDAFSGAQQAITTDVHPRSIIRGAFKTGSLEILPS